MFWDEYDAFFSYYVSRPGVCYYETGQTVNYEDCDCWECLDMLRDSFKFKENRKLL